MHNENECWATSLVTRELLEQRHQPHWQAIIKAIIEASLKGQVVLDYGCNLGGFLRVLYDCLAYERGVGADSDQSAISEARQQSVGYPIEYVWIKSNDRDWAEDHKETFDLAFSHEVIHLIKWSEDAVQSMYEHAVQIRTALKPGSCYYVVRSFYKDPEIRIQHEGVLEGQKIPHVKGLTPDKVAEGFEAAGFEVTLRLLPFDWFASWTKKEKVNYGSLTTMVEHYSQNKLLFRFIKK